MSVVRDFNDRCIGSLVRRRAAVHRIPLDRFEVRAARSTEELQQAFTLLHKVYAERRLEEPRQIPLRITPQHVLQESLVLTAWDADRLSGTLTLTSDSQAGVPLEKDYPQQIARLRAQGARFVEFNSLAVDREYRGAKVNLLLYMAAYWITRQPLAATHIVMGVHPRAENIYRLLLGFGRMGACRAHGELRAPVVGLIGEVSRMDRWFSEYFTKPLSDGRTVYEHVCAPHRCIRLPDQIDCASGPAWKLPRAVFQELFIHRTKRLASLDTQTRIHLRSQRTDETLKTFQRNG